LITAIDIIRGINPCARNERGASLAVRERA
jgi:hypothetical protein